MTTQVVFKIDKGLKARAMRKARGEGVPFASVLKFATRAYVAGQFDAGLVPNEPFNAATRRELTRALRDIAAGKNLSPRFANARDATAYLEKA